MVDPWQPVYLPCGDDHICLTNGLQVASQVIWEATMSSTAIITHKILSYSYSLSVKIEGLELDLSLIYNFD